MKNVLILALAFFAIRSLGQNLEKKYSVVTPAALQNPKIQWVDADNDSLLDAMISNTVQGEIKFMFLRNLGNNSFNLAQSIPSGYQYGKVFLTDFNNDNKIDIVISGKNSSNVDGTEVFLNTGNFSFQKSQIKIQSKAFTDILFADLNNDGKKDLVASDANKLYLFEQTKEQFILRKDTAIIVSSLKSFDFDANGFHDVAFSGLDLNNTPTTAILLLGNNFKVLSKVQVADVSGSLEAGDLNHDGFFDIIVSGKNSTGTLVTRSFQNNVLSFSPDKKIFGIDSVSIRIADFTSDGKADVAFFGKNNNAWISWIKTFTGDSVSLPFAKVKTQDYGDYDRDGDLDLVQLRKDSIIVFNNNLNVINKGPSVVGHPIAVQIYDRIFFYWNKAADDHTDSSSVTYDLSAYKNDSAVVSSEYDHLNHERLLVTHGNLGTANYSIQKVSGDFFEVQSIDNSFTVRTKFPLGKCSSCTNVMTQNITLCKFDSVILSPNAPKAMWFSFNKGFLGIHDVLSYKKSEADTIFSFNPLTDPCSAIKIFNISSSSSDTVKVVRNLWNCEGSQNILTIDAEWHNVTWKNSLNTTVSSGNQLTALLGKSIVFNASGNNDQGCRLKETINLSISKPDLKIENGQYQIIKGGNVQLSASGGNSYSWSPSSSLSSDIIAAPVATPEITTEYTVTAKDSLGCAASAKILVEVMEAGFIPTLFTPNGDGKNDDLRIFGLTTASGFRFTIYNREGNVVYDTKDVSTAVYQGWNGASNGQMQPSGTYFWKVEGKGNLGEAITLNGKKSGAFLLVR